MRAKYIFREAIAELKDQTKGQDTAMAAVWWLEFETVTLDNRNQQEHFEDKINLQWQVSDSQKDKAYKVLMIDIFRI